jgi:hypothetical protein
VKIFEVNDTTKIPVSELFTDSDGNYSLVDLGKGTYNVYAEKDSLVAFQDSISVLNDTVLIENDTLETPTTLTAVVGLQPNHDPRTVTVQVLGTDIYSNVDESGYFTLDRMAVGDFTLRLSTTLDNYTNTFKNISINANSNDTLSDTLHLIYTGVPIVTNIETSYDTLNGVVKLAWDKSIYSNLMDYAIFRTTCDSIGFSEGIYDITTDTIYYDSVFSKADSTVDTIDLCLAYQVIIRNNNNGKGLPYKYSKINAICPEKIKTKISLSSFNSRATRWIDSSSINDSILIVADWNNDLYGNKSIGWTLENDTLVTKDLGDKTKGKDSIWIQFDTLGKHVIICSVVDVANRTWVDCVFRSIRHPNPVQTGT